MLSRAAAPVAAVLLALAAGAAILVAAGRSPMAAFGAMWAGAFGGPESLGNTLRGATPLLLTGLGVAWAFRGGLINIGGEGQIYVGALLAVLVGLWAPGLPAAVHIPLALLAGFAGGAAWGALPGWLKARWDKSEIITTILLNYIAFWFVSYLVAGPLMDPQSFGYPWTAEVVPSARLPLLLPAPFRVHAGVALGAAAAVCLHLLLWRTIWGFEVRAVGEAPAAARLAGMPVPSRVVTTMAVAGGLAGLAGAVELLGVQWRLSDFFSPGWGYSAIAVALVGEANPGGVVLSALFFSALSTGAASMERLARVPAAVGDVIQGLSVLFVVLAQGPGLRRWLDSFRRAGPEGARAR